MIFILWIICIILHLSIVIKPETTVRAQIRTCNSPPWCSKREAAEHVCHRVWSSLAPWISKFCLLAVPACEKGYTPLSPHWLYWFEAPGSVCWTDRCFSLAVWVQMPELQARVELQAHPWSEQLVSANSRLLCSQQVNLAPNLTSNQRTELWALHAHTWKSGALAFYSTLLYMKP